MAVWSFYDYVELTGRNPFYEWQSALPEASQAFIDARILQMAALERWPEKWISKYRETDKIYELRIPHKKVQYRPLGIYAPGRSFIFVAGAVEKDGKLPRDTINAAVERQKTLAREPHHVREHRYY
jgi:Phage derived protein Gp49-like (DUF891)